MTNTLAVPDEKAMKPTVSFVVSFSPDDDNKEEVIQRYLEALEELPHSYEIIVVNNGTGRELNTKLAEVFDAAGVTSQILHLHSPAMESRALSLGFRECSGTVVVVLPSYIQVDPSEINRLIERITSGELDVVGSWRCPRVDQKRDGFKSRVFNWFTRRVTGASLHDINSTLRATTREVVQDIAVYGDLFRFLPIIAAKAGYRVGEVKVRHVEERVRKGDYRIGVYVRRLLDLLTLFFLLKFTSKPLRFFGLIGSGALSVGFLVSAVIVVQRLYGRGVADRPLLVFGVMLIVLGAQLFSIGLLGELVIFTHSRDLKEYKVEKVHDTRET